MFKKIVHYFFCILVCFVVTIHAQSTQHITEKDKQKTQSWIKNHASLLNDHELNILANFLYQFGQFNCYDNGLQKRTPILMTLLWHVRTNVMTYQHDAEKIKELSELYEQFIFFVNQRRLSHARWASCYQYIENMPKGALSNAISAFQDHVEKTLTNVIAKKDSQEISKNFEQKHDLLKEKGHIFATKAEHYKDLINHPELKNNSNSTKALIQLNTAFQIATGLQEECWDTIEKLTSDSRTIYALQEITEQFITMYYGALFDYAQKNKKLLSCMDNEQTGAFEPFHKQSQRLLPKHIV